MEKLEIIYIDDFLVAINKPAGLLVHRTDLHRFATEFVVQILRDQLNMHVYPIHRLDKPTSGKLYIDNTDVSTLNDNQLAKIRREKIGFFF